MIVEVLYESNNTPDAPKYRGRRAYYLLSKLPNNVSRLSTNIRVTSFG